MPANRVLLCCFKYTKKHNKLAKKVLKFSENDVTI